MAEIEFKVKYLSLDDQVTEVGGDGPPEIVEMVQFLDPETAEIQQFPDPQYLRELKQKKQAGAELCQA